jgi:hypothetical protein
MPTLDLALAFTDFQTLPAAEAESSARRIADENARRAFDLARAPLLRAVLVQVGPARHLLTLVVHQIVFDGFSMQVLSRELGVLYDAFILGQPSPLSSLPVQYSDFTSWKRELLRGTTLTGQFAYWRNVLSAPYTPLALPADHPRGQAQTGPAMRIHFALGRRLTHAVARLGREESTTHFAILVAALQALLYQYTGQTDVIVFASTAARSRPEMAGIIGLFANVLPLRTSLAPDLSFRELLRCVRRAIIEAFANQDVPFEEIVDQIVTAAPAGPSRSTSLFQVMLIYQNSPRMAIDVDGAHFDPAEEFDNGAAKFDFLFEVALAAETGLGGWLKFRRDTFEPGTIQTLLRDLQILLESALADPDANVSGLLPTGHDQSVPDNVAPQGAKTSFIAPRDPLEWQLEAICQ